MKEGQNGYVVKTESFTGPLDLLLSLVEKRKLMINEVSLAEVTDQYIRHIEQITTFSLAHTSHFIYVASTLLLIKSRSLLPSLSLTEEEETSIEDLEERLNLYRIFKRATTALRREWGSALLFFPSRTPQKSVVFAPAKDITADALYTHAMHIIAALPAGERTERPEAVVERIASLEETVAGLAERVSTSMRVSFRDFTQNVRAEKKNLVVSFLAVLELVKRGVISASQKRQFDDITMEREGIDTPQY